MYCAFLSVELLKKQLENVIIGKLETDRFRNVSLLEIRLRLLPVKTIAVRLSRYKNVLQK